MYYFAAPQHPTPRCIIPLDSVTVREYASLSHTLSRTEQVSCGCQAAYHTAVHGGRGVLTAGREYDQAAKGSSSVEIILYSNFGTVIKSVKIVEGRMVQVSHRGCYSQCLP